MALQTDTLKNVDNTKQAPVGDLIDGRCTAWVRFDGLVALDITDSFNITNLVKNATGDYSFSFINAMDTTTYIAIGTCNNDTPNPTAVNNLKVENRTVNGFSAYSNYINPTGGAEFDRINNDIVIFGGKA